MLPYATRQSPFFRDVFSEGEGDAAASFEDRPIEEVRAAFQENSVANRLDNCLAFGSWLHRRDALTRSEGYLYLRALTTMGRYAEAVSILADGRYTNERSWRYWLALATALAGTGQVSQAAEAIARALEVGGEGNPRTAALAEALDCLRRRGPAAEGTPSPTAAAALVRSWLVLGLPARAVDVLEAAFDGSPPRTDEDVLQALLCAQQVARFADAPLAGRLEAVVRRHFEPLGLFRVEEAGAFAAGEASSAGPAPAGEAAVQYFLALVETRQGLHQLAATRLGPMAPRFTDEVVPGAVSARLDLAACVGRVVIDEVRPQLRTRGPRKIVDMFLFADEFGLLRMKLEEMYDWVDHFVLVEAPVTFRGDPKPLHFAERRAEFASFADKIVHVVVDTVPEGLDNAWGRQFYQRDCGLRAVAELCAEDDIVLVSDTDEVIDRGIVESFTGPFASLGLRYYSYFFNLERIESPQSRWTAMLRARHLTKIGAGYARLALPFYAKSYFIENAGWHFSKVRSASDLARKFGRNSNIVRSAVDQETLSNTIARIRSKGGWPGYVRRGLDELPGYIRRNADDLGELIL